MPSELARQVPQLGTLVGPNHRTQAFARKLVRRGDIRRVGRVRYLANGNVIIRYIRLRPEGAVRRRLLIRTYTLSASALTFLCAVGSVAWAQRYTLLALAGGGLLAASLLYLVTRGRHTGACVGLHCPGCRH